MKNIQPKKASSTRSGCGPATTTAPTAPGADPGPKQPDRSPPGRHRASAPTTSRRSRWNHPNSPSSNPTTPTTRRWRCSRAPTDRSANPPTATCPPVTLAPPQLTVIEPDTDDPDDPDVPLVALRQSDGSVSEPADGDLPVDTTTTGVLIVDGNGV